MTTEDIPTTSGLADFVVDGKTYQTFYIIYGDLRNLGKRRPLVGLHGGPGFSHHYMIIPVVLYDQIGNGASSHIRDAPTEFWTLELFMNELENLLKHLGIQDNFDLLGHSWGGMLASAYASIRIPSGLHRLIIANSPASGPLMMQGFNDLLDLLPGNAAEIVRSNEAAGTLQDLDYQKTLEVFQKKHICALDPWPQGLVDSFEEYKKDQTVYLALWGTLEFQLTGNLKDWSIIPSLAQISVPTLLLSSPQDEIQPVAYMPFFEHIPKVKWVDIPGCSHVAMYEAPDRYFDALISFLNV
ncbi:L-amino acid amidase [Psilocybe cubensis]|uniref:L-amino acid amidase n=2 Tax=Psilocybe cubensis TaxID=181762 RepID=A0ACB8HI69_PSICU|nr:L-amino acid amidase [Psilocybe cubensis]KAH9487467.1 L-amino acid amidase [Psilocybe cubensis]